MRSTVLAFLIAAPLLVSAKEPAPPGGAAAKGLSLHDPAIIRHFRDLDHDVLVRNDAEPLTVRAAAPTWWQPALPETTGTLDSNATFRILEHRTYNTVFGQDVWLRIEATGQHKEKTPVDGWIRLDATSHLD